MTPTKIKLLRDAAELELHYGEASYRLSAEFLRVHSPSAEVRGHGKGQEQLQTGKSEVGISKIEPVGNYGVKLTFSDGHDSGIYTWPLLHDFCLHHHHYWQTYLDTIEKAGASRLPDNVQVIKLL
ncbi:DUF971 domain-containing protein [Gilvimarinus agarilyticus]|uniref:gamma-butyrobetaine hydroxylase-like domain-containing protein n=1 Tax=unclassified Gilvimarinus TaxID=2642066 RepID=UPI001C098CE0|nr:MULTISPECIES: DUF971 domain-containing protein [unclassified Gilvimarinus]MBU2886611.1 DUF971 domain-containing protein [Gilvimarinus agarilyticus]MDO6571279.1 DUF971 domain-containing protein [Gilvimarinus sp. 2_MG-2023]MDO6746346.1 DUF971 domain-containing protein [Gilvimarinus sp. 1_MG-2023]